MRLEDVQYFLAVARLAHVGRAAESVGVTQPAITKGIQRLEKELGLRLFDRTPKGMLLTTPGETFYARFSQISLDIEDALREADNIHHGTLGRIRIGVTPLLTEGFLNAACVELMTHRPAARLMLTVSMHDMLLPALKQGELDLIVSSIHDSTRIPGLLTEELFQDKLYVAARSGHPLFNQTRIQASDLVQYGWVLPGRRLGAWQWLHDRFEELDFPPPNVVMQTNTTIGNLLSVIHQTDLLTLASEMSLATPLGKDLSVIPLDSLTWHRKIGLYLRKGAYRSPLTQRLIDIIKHHALDRPTI